MTTCEDSERLVRENAELAAALEETRIYLLRAAKVCMTSLSSPLSVCDEEGRHICYHNEWGKRCFALLERSLNPAAILRAHVKPLVDALGPFAALADLADSYRHSDDSTCEWRLRAGDLRAARDAYRKART